MKPDFASLNYRKWNDSSAEPRVLRGVARENAETARV